MKIKWLGHSCFLLTTEDGTRIVTDPYDPDTMVPELEVHAEVLTMSHHHFDHGYEKAVHGFQAKFDSQGEFSFADIEIKGFPTFHDEVNGEKRGKNTVFMYTADGLTICHCGDLGHLPDEELLDEMRKADIVLMPVGGTFTIDAEEAAQLVEMLDVPVTIPMHYKNEHLKFDLASVDDFLKACENKGISHKLAKSSEVEVSKENLANLSKIYVLEYEP